MDFEIIGEAKQAVEVKLKEGETLLARPGSMAWMQGDIQPATRAKEGISGSVGRALPVETHYLNTYQCRGESGSITFTAKTQSKILEMELKEAEKLICRQGIMLVAANTISILVDIKENLEMGLLSQTNLLVEQFGGPGKLYLAITGDAHEVELKEGQTMKADPDRVACYQPSVRREIELIRGVRPIHPNVDNLYLVNFNGPGKVWLQSTPFNPLASQMHRRSSSEE